MQKNRIDPINLLWVTNNKFQSKVNILRSKYGLKGEDLPITIDIEELGNIGWDREKFDSFNEDLMWIIWEFNLSGWERELKDFLTTGKVSKVHVLSPPRIEEQFNGTLLLSIVISKPINKTTLKKWIDKNWVDGAKIDSKIRSYLVDFMEPGEKSVSSFEIIKRVFELKDKGDLSFSEIASKLADEFPITDKGKLNEESVKQLYYDHKAYANTLKKRYIAFKK